MIRGIDVSENNGYLDADFWKAVVEAGCKFAYIRCSWGNGHEDGEFRHNVQMAHEYGLLVGAYHYDYSLTPDITATHARKCAAIIADSGVLLELPVFFDLEDADGWKDRNGYDFLATTLQRSAVHGLITSGYKQACMHLTAGLNGLSLIAMGAETGR